MESSLGKFTVKSNKNFKAENVTFGLYVYAETALGFYGVQEFSINLNWYPAEPNDV